MKDNTIFASIMNLGIIMGISGLLFACGHTAGRYSTNPTPVLSYGSMADFSPYQDVINAENYTNFSDNQIKIVNQNPVSTFSIDVDTASYTNARRFINNGQYPPKHAVRVEEFINYFDYNYPIPQDEDQPFSVSTEIGPTPWNQDSYLLHVGIKGYQSSVPSNKEKNLVFLIDVSGSMNAENKLELLKKSFKLLVKQLSSEDRIAIVVYAGASGLVLESTSGQQKYKILNALNRLSAGGSTNGGEGIELAYQVAQDSFIDNGINRVILATDGDFNVGVTNIEQLKSLVKRKKQSGVGLTVLGFGTGNYNDNLLETISNIGDANAAYIDSLQEAHKVLVNDINATLHTIARDTKIQIEFNPAVVSDYRLIGYENRILEREDFSNDKVDAGDIGEGHTVTAIYEINIVGQAERRLPALRYEIEKPVLRANDNAELAFLKIRYKQAKENHSQLIKHIIHRKQIKKSLRQTSDSFRFSAAVAAFGQRLREGQYTMDYELNDIAKLANNSRGEDNFGYRSEFVKLVSLANSLQ